MLITVNEFLYSGIRISSDIANEEIEFAIKTVEQFYLKNKITDQHYIELTTTPATSINYILLNGGNIDNKVYAGLKYALYHLVYGYLIIDNFRISRYSSVEKTSEFSKTVKRDELFEQGRNHWNIGMAAVEEVMTYYGLDIQDNKDNNLYEGLLW